MNQITILGSGTGVPSLKRRACSVLVQTEHSNILLDCGPGCIHRLLEIGLTVHEITHILVTHTHPDHTSDLIPLWFATKYFDQGMRQHLLTCIGTKTFWNWAQQIKTAYNPWLNLSDTVERFIELNSEQPDECAFEEMLVYSRPMNHLKTISIAYKLLFRSSGKTLVYSGDTDWTPELIELSLNADMLICESSLPDVFKVSGHLTPSLAGQIATQANVKTLVLTHLYPQCDQIDIVNECRKTYQGHLIIAEDHMKLTL